MMDHTTCAHSSCPRYGLSILLLLAALSMHPHPAPHRSVMPAVRAAILDHLYCAFSWEVWGIEYMYIMVVGDTCGMEACLCETVRVSERGWA